MDEMDAIPVVTALGLCKEIRQANRGRWYTANGLRCMACAALSRGNTEKMRIASKRDYRGCEQVNVRFDALPRPAAPPPPEVEIETNIIYLPPAGFSATQRRRTCAGCGRQFRIAASQQESDYCPTCDYRRLRGQLIQQAGEDSDED